jgi:hypothetical protein
LTADEEESSEEEEESDEEEYDDDEVTAFLSRLRDAFFKIFTEGWGKTEIF